MVSCSARLTKLERLRLEKGHVPGCPVIPIIESVAKLPALRQLEIINFDVKPGLDKALAMCKQVRRLLIIPTYITTVSVLIVFLSLFHCCKMLQFLSFLCHSRQQQITLSSAAYLCWQTLWSTLFGV